MPFYEVEIEHLDTDQVFSYYHGPDASGGYDMLHFNVTLLARLRDAMPDQFRRITMDFGDAEYELCMQHRGIEEPKITALEPKQLREPGYGVLFDDGLFSIVDGHHRLVRRYRGGVRVMDFWVTHRDVWQHCLVEYSEEGEKILSAAMPERVENPVNIASHVTLHPKDKP